MEKFRQSLLNAERLDLAAELARCGDELPFLCRLADFPCGERSLLEHTQSAMDALLGDPPPAPPRSTNSVLVPWWSPMPAAYVAALFQHVGLPEACSSSAGRVPLTMPHARESVHVMRDVLRSWGVPFTVREHAVALVLSQDRPAGLVGSGAPPETYMRLSCALDLMALYHLRRADRRASGAESDVESLRLEAFRKRAEEIGVFGCPYVARLAPERMFEVGFKEPRERHRMLNSMRYFELVARMNEEEWFVERLRLARDKPRGRLHLLVGPAGCGKSHWAGQHLADTAIVSSDRMREELTGDPADQSQNYLVFQRCMDRIRERLRDGEEVTFDATNYSEELRSMPVQAARWSGAEIVSYFFDVSLAGGLARNAMRARSVPEEAIRKQYRLLELPALYEADRNMVVGQEGGASLYWPAEMI
jgi:predicted kinase